MSFIVPEEIERYAEAHTTPPTQLLAELAEETQATLDSPQMLTGTIEGRLLEHARLRARSASACSSSAPTAATRRSRWPRGSPRAATSTPARSTAARRRGAALHRPQPVRRPDHDPPGPALETIERLGGEFDFVFIDADKENYPNYYEALLPRLAPRGLMAIDNTLWSGRVLDESDDEDDDAGDPRAERPRRGRRAGVAVQLTVRDGVTLIRRKP